MWKKLTQNYQFIFKPYQWNVENSPILFFTLSFPISRNSPIPAKNIFKTTIKTSNYNWKKKKRSTSTITISTPLSIQRSTIWYEENRTDKNNHKTNFWAEINRSEQSRQILTVESKTAQKLATQQVCLKSSLFFSPAHSFSQIYTIKSQICKKKFKKKGWE